MDELFNVFKNLNLYENHHSNLLKKILNPRGKHGQRDLFLASFLELINVPYEKEHWDVCTEKKAGEKGRIDLILFSNDKKVIIENKINRAENQQNQLYRYWKNEIFNLKDFSSFCKEKGGNIDNEAFYEEYYKSEKCTKKFKMIYLSLSKNNNPERLDNSKEKPQNPTYREKFKDLPSKLPMFVDELSYKEHISPWLKSCLTKIQGNSESDERLKIVLEQYVEYIDKYIDKFK